MSPGGGGGGVAGGPGSAGGGGGNVIGGPGTVAPTGPAAPQTPAIRAAVISGIGLVARFSPIRGVTPKSALNRRIWLPAMLNNFTVDEQALHNEYDTLSAGHFSQPQMGAASARQFRTLTAEAITVAFDADYLVATGQDPYEIGVRLHEILRAKKPVHLLAVYNPPEPAPELDMACTFRQITKEVRPGERETKYFTIVISEWRDPHVKRRSANPTHKLPTTHKLKATDTLSSLSFKYYGRYDRWKVIRNANHVPKRFGQNTPLVQLRGHWKVGHKVKIPALTG